MDITYPLLIQEDTAQLHAAEKAARDKTRADLTIHQFSMLAIEVVRAGRLEGF